jgi:hypothetical protein
MISYGLKLLYISIGKRTDVGQHSTIVSVAVPLVLVDEQAALKPWGQIPGE